MSNDLQKLEYVFSHKEMLEIADRVFEFCMAATGITLFDYQRGFGLRIVQSLLLEDGDEITALFARQSGKTEVVANVVDGCCVMLPSLAKVEELARDSRIRKFKDGLWVGIFAPTYELGGVMHSRMAARMGSKSMLEVMSDPDIDIDPGKGRQILNLDNGSYIDCISAAPGTKIEGKTYHLLILEECQDISDYKIKKSIHPMAAWVSGSIVKIGTPAPIKGDFYDACQRNRRQDLLDRPNSLQSHYQYDYTHAARVNPRYAAFIEKELERYDYDSDYFRMSYRLHWLLERGMFIAPERLEECGISKREVQKVKIRGKTHKFVRPAMVANSDWSTENQVASIDFGREEASTVVTVARVWWANPVDVAGENRYYTHVVNWLELFGDDHEEQYPQILNFLENFNIGTLIVDATGKGDPIYSRLAYDLGKESKEKGEILRVIPFVFSEQSKDLGYKILNQELRARRLTFPSGEGVKKKKKWKQFIKQMTDLEKSWRGKYMHVAAPKRGKKKREEGDEYHDDYPDSLMMLCWAVNKKSDFDIEVEENPIFGKKAKHSLRRANKYMERIRKTTRRRIWDR